MESALLEVPTVSATVGAALTLFSYCVVIDQHLVRRRPQHICFIDITKAYDCVDRATAWKTLLNRGAPPKIVQLPRDMHTGTRYVVRALGLGLREAFAVLTGFKQGDVISPMLFNLVHGLCHQRCHAYHQVIGDHVSIHHQCIMVLCTNLTLKNRGGRLTMDPIMCR